MLWREAAQASKEQVAILTSSPSRSFTRFFFFAFFVCISPMTQRAACFALRSPFLAILRKSFFEYNHGSANTLEEQPPLVIDFPLACWTRFPGMWTLALISLIALEGCNMQSEHSSLQRTSDSSMEANPSLIQHAAPNNLGYAKVWYRDGDTYREGISDRRGQMVIPLLSEMLVQDITGNLALIQFERKFLFVPLDQGPYSREDFEEVVGFQYAMPYQCGLALVVVDDEWFYINPESERAFAETFEFAETFHHDRALVKNASGFQILDSQGNTVAKLPFEQVSPQSEWCWQVIVREEGKYKSGFIGLNGEALTKIEFDDVGYYDPEVKRIIVRVGRHFGYLDEYAKIAIPLQYEYAEIFDRGKAKVVQDGRTFFIDPNGNEVPD